jgi:hypothetical protein
MDPDYDPGTDPDYDPGTDPDPAVLSVTFKTSIKNLFAYYFLKGHLHHFSKMKSQDSRNQCLWEAGASVTRFLRISLPSQIDGVT